MGATATADPLRTKAAERDVVSLLLIDPSQAMQLGSMLEAEDFENQPLRVLFEAVLELAKRGSDYSLTILAEHLQAHGQLALVGGVHALVRLTEVGINPAMLKHHARLVRDGSIMRSRLAQLEEAQAAVRSVELGMEREDLRDLILNQARDCMDLAERFDGESEAVTLDGLLHQLQQDLADGKDLRGEPTGISDLDAVFNGWTPGELVVLGARPSVGKSLVSMDLGIRAAEPRWRDTERKEGINVLYVSTEMSERQLAFRAAARLSGVPFYKLQSGRLTTTDREKLATGVKRGEALSPKIKWLYLPEAAPQAVYAAALGMKQRKGLDLVVVDYLQRMKPVRNLRERKGWEEKAEVARYLKTMAMQLDCTVLACAQLSRGAVQQQGGRPGLHHLRESGDIEAEADAVFLLSRVEEQGMEVPGQVWMDLAKQRQGQTQAVKCSINPALMHFGEPEAVNAPIPPGWEPGS